MRVPPRRAWSEAYALAAGVRAIDAQLQRLNLPGKAMQVEDAPGAFQVRYELTGHPAGQRDDPQQRPY